MKEYFRIMFSELDPLNSKDWDKFHRYGLRTIVSLSIVCITVWTIALILTIVK